MRAQKEKKKKEREPYSVKRLVTTAVSDQLVKVRDALVQLLLDTDGLAVLLVQQHAELAQGGENEVLAHPPAKLGVEDSGVVWVGQDQKTVISEGLVNQGLGALAGME